MNKEIDIIRSCTIRWVIINLETIICNHSTSCKMRPLALTAWARQDQWTSERHKRAGLGREAGMIVISLVLVRTGEREGGLQWLQCSGRTKRCYVGYYACVTLRARNSRQDCLDRARCCYLWARSPEMSDIFAFAQWHYHLESWYGLWKHDVWTVQSSMW